MKKYSKKYWVLRWLFLAGYLAAAGVLIFESTLPRGESAKRSEAVGTVVGGIINDMNGDQAKEILPTKAIIQNKETDFKVGEETTIEIETEPKDATYRSYTYASNNEEVATVDETGLVSFIKAGSVIITATNTKVPEVFDTITFNVSNIEVTSMTSSINATKEGEVYKLEIYKSYVIKNVIEPSNATDKTITYDYTPNEYFELNDDTIQVIGDSGEEVIEISVTCGSITNLLKVKTYAPQPIVEDYPIEGIKASNISKFIDQTGVFNPSVSYIPTYTSSKYKGYTLSTSDTAIIAIQSNKTSMKITGTTGTASVTVTSTYDETITTTFNVTVSARPTITSITLGSYSSVMYVGTSQTVSVSVTPSTALVTKTFSSSNPIAISVTNAGKLTANALGSSTITATVKDSYNKELTKTFTVQVKEKPLNAATDFEINYKVSENPIVYAEEEFNLDNYFGIKSFTGNSAPLDNNAYAFSFNIGSDVGVYNDHKFIAHKVGEINGQITFTNEDNSIIAKDIRFTVVDRFGVYLGEEKVSSDIELDIYTTIVLTIKDNNKSGQSYKIVNTDNTIVYSYSSKSVTVTAKEAGTGTLRIVPVIKQEGYDDKELNDYGKSVSFVVSDVMTTKMDVTIYKDNGDIIDVKDEEVILLYMNEKLSVKYILDENTTKSRVTMTLNNTNASIRNGLITPLRIGNTRLTVKENETGIVKEYDIAIRHKVALKDDGPFLLSGLADYEAESNTVVITNGDWAKIAVNFTEDSSFKRVTYEVENANICTIGNDGNITPLKAGTTKVVVTSKDSSYTYIQFEINIKVQRRPFITDMNEFFQKVRKTIGHFGAFAVFGFLGAMTWFLWLRGKYLFPVGVVANFGLGFGLAWLTEYIQAFVPGRTSTWSDIWLDFNGFAILAGVTTGIIVIWWVVRLIIRIVKNKKAQQTESPVETDNNETSEK